MMSTASAVRSVGLEIEERGGDVCGAVSGSVVVANGG
jgi:hypothetical protein